MNVVELLVVFIGDDIFAANTKAAGFFASQRWLLVFNYE